LIFPSSWSASVAAPIASRPAFVRIKLMRRPPASWFSSISPSTPPASDDGPRRH
jgi:hypothetical protein